MISMSEIGKRVKALRESRGLSQQAVADYCGVSRVAVTKWENGDTSNMKFSNITKLLQLFNIGYEELTTGKHTTQGDRASLIINQLKNDRERDYALHTLRVCVAKMTNRINGDSQIPAILSDQEFDQGQK